MSRENVEIVLRVIDAFNGRDLTAVSREVIPDVEVDWSRSIGVNAGVYHGRAETSRFWASFFEVFERIAVTPEELIEHGDSVVLVDRTCMRGRDGIEVEAHNASVVTFRDRRIASWTMYESRAAALKAVGLEE